MDNIGRFLEGFAKYIIDVVHSLLTYLWNLTITQKALFIITLNSLAQLGFSQTHISAISQVFKTEIGIWLFAFIIAGLVTLFNVTRIRTNVDRIITILFTLTTSVIGFVYASIAIKDRVAYSVVSKSMNLTFVGIAAYICAAVLLVIAIFIDKKEIKGE